MKELRDLRYTMYNPHAFIPTTPSGGSQPMSTRNLDQMSVDEMCLNRAILNSYHRNNSTDMRIPPCGANMSQSHRGEYFGKRFFRGSPI